MKKLNKLLFLLLIISVVFSGCVEDFSDETIPSGYNDYTADTTFPEYSGSPYTVINKNVPFFTKEDYTTESFENYSYLDSLGRCGVCIASVGRDLMPDDERESIGQVKPTGWHTVKYDFVDGKYLYNRCHLIGFQLTGENANERNLITGTRYLNVEGMLPFENMVADYVKETGNHVLYRVTPVYTEDNLVADGVLMEALSMEDNGDGICFNVFCYNVQPGVIINYASGESTKDESYSENDESYSTEKGEYILNTSSKKVHRPECSSVLDIKEKNKKSYSGSLADIVNQGYNLCKICID